MPGSKKQNSMFKKTEGYVQVGNPFPVASCGIGRNLGSPINKRVNKDKMPCNKPRASTKANKKKMVKACEGGKERIVHFGEKGYGHNYSAAARKSFRARHKCSEKKNMFIYKKNNFWKSLFWLV